MPIEKFETDESVDSTQSAPNMANLLIETIKSLKQVIENQNELITKVENLSKEVASLRNDSTIDSNPYAPSTWRQTTTTTYPISYYTSNTGDYTAGENDPRPILTMSPTITAALDNVDISAWETLLRDQMTRISEEQDERDVDYSEPDEIR